MAKYDEWNYADMIDLSERKKGVVLDERNFIEAANNNFTPYYNPMVPWVNRLRKVVFPNGRRRETEDSGLYAQMREILGEARKDPKVLAEV